MPRYVSHLIAVGSPHEAWAVAEDDALMGRVCVTVDEVNRSGWFWYWMTIFDPWARVDESRCGDSRGLGAG